MRSLDGGWTWETVFESRVDQFDLVVDTNGTVFVGGWDGIHLSTDHGENWESLQSDLPEGPVLCLAADQTGPVEPIPDLLVMSNLDMFFGKSPLDKNQELEIGDPETEWKRSNPDIVVYKPKEGDLNDGDNDVVTGRERPGV